MENTSIRLLIAVMFWTVVPFGYIFCENSVHLKSPYNQLITSSTLKWISPINGKIPENAVVGSVEFIADGEQQNDLQYGNTPKITQKKIFICRANHNGAWIPGGVHEDRSVCQISFVGRIYTYSRYELLQNTDNAARLIWKDWDKHEAIPLGAVFSGGDTFVAHRVSPKFKVMGEDYAVGMSYLIGKLDPKEGVFGKISIIDEDGIEQNQLGDGQVLIEIEPIKYELTISKLYDLRKKVEKRNIILGEVTLQNNDGISPMNVDTIIAYQWNYSSNWGQGKAVLKGLPTTINFINGSEVEYINWGITRTEHREEIERIESALDPGVAVHVTLKGNISDVEIPYTGKLLSVFNDSTIMSRTVYDTWQQTVMLDIVPVFGPLYFIHNLSLVPTTTTTTTTAPSTIVTTTTTETPTLIPVETKDSEVYTDPPSVKRDDFDTMVGDEGAQQLKKKETGGPSSGFTVYQNISLIMFLILITILV